MFGTFVGRQVSSFLLSVTLHLLLKDQLGRQVGLVKRKWKLLSSNGSAKEP